MTCAKAYGFRDLCTVKRYFACGLMDGETVLFGR